MFLRSSLNNYPITPDSLTIHAIPSQSPSSRTMKDASQQARKRAMDRSAQRTLREKTKRYIAHLEATVEACKQQNQNNAVERLLAQSRELHSEIERLRKILSNVRTLLLPELTDLPFTVPVDDPPVDDQNDAGHDDQRVNISPTAPAQPTLLSASNVQDHIQHTQDLLGNPQSQHPHEYQTEQSTSLQGLTGFESNRNNDTHLSSWQDYQGSYVHTLQGQTRHSKYGEPNSQIDTADTAALSMSTTPSSPRLIQQPGALWITTNIVLSRVLDIDAAEAVRAEDVDPGCIFQGVSQGWNTLEVEQQRNPVIRILQEYDQVLMQGCDPINRVAIAYKNHRLIKYYLNPTTQELEQIPTWLRPLPNYRNKQHPVGVEFFAWPALREQFILGQNEIYATMQFCLSYRRNFRFVWPFPFEHTHKKNPVTGKHSPTPLFERYHADLRNWTMDEVFFTEFPDLAQNMIFPSCAEVTDIAASAPQTTQTAHKSTNEQGIQDYSSEMLTGLPENISFDTHDHWLLELLPNMPNTA